ncbi:MAG TPA: FMN-binding protein [Longimicrobiales bacterium]|nr:FMN-binding protein [Longimicrobiales bacterium]
MSPRQELPVSPGQSATGAGAGDGAPATPPPAAQVPAWRLIATLAVAGALAGLLIVVVFEWAQPRILAYRAEVMAVAIQEVLVAPARTQTLFVQDGRLVPEAPAGADTIRAEKVFAGFDEGGRLTGYAILGAKAGFQDVIQLIFGYDPATRRVLGMKVLESKETPGLGDKIFKDLGFVAGFAGAAPPIRGVKPGAGTGAPEEVDMITGATISSRAVIDIINARIAALGPALEGTTSTSTSASTSQVGGASGARQ